MLAIYVALSSAAIVATKGASPMTEQTEQTIETTVQENEKTIIQAKHRAISRIRAELQRAVPTLKRLGCDCPSNRELARKLCGLAIDGDNKFAYVHLDGSSVGVDANGSVYVPEPQNPVHADSLMLEARKLVALIIQGVERYMAGHVAETWVAVSQWDESAL
jgi:hypothetical protein